MRLVPTRSASLPAGTARKNDTSPATVRPTPTWAAESPTTWVKNTALPVMKVPSPTANRIDWTLRRRASGEGGSWRRHHPGSGSTGGLVGAIAPERPEDSGRSGGWVVIAAHSPCGTSVRLVNSLRPVRGDAADVVAGLRDWLAVMAEPAPLVVETS